MYFSFPMGSGKKVAVSLTSNNNYYTHFPMGKGGKKVALSLTSIITITTLIACLVTVTTLIG